MANIKDLRKKRLPEHALSAFIITSVKFVLIKTKIQNITYCRCITAKRSDSLKGAPLDRHSMRRI